MTGAEEQNKGDHEVHERKETGSFGQKNGADRQDTKIGTVEQIGLQSTCGKKRTVCVAGKSTGKEWSELCATQATRLKNKR